MKESTCLACVRCWTGSWALQSEAMTASKKHMRVRPTLQEWPQNWLKWLIDQVVVRVEIHRNTYATGKNSQVYTLLENIVSFLKTSKYIPTYQVAVIYTYCSTPWNLTQEKWKQVLTPSLVCDYSSWHDGPKLAATKTEEWMNKSSMSADRIPLRRKIGMLLRSVVMWMITKHKG